MAAGNFLVSNFPKVNLKKVVSSDPAVEFSLKLVSHHRAIATAFCLSVAVLTGCSTMVDGSSAKLSVPLREGILAGDIGTGLSETAKRSAADAEFRALEGGQTGAPVAWKISDTVQGSVVPQQPYAVGSANCRRYSHSITSSGQVRTATGTACRREDGIWRPLA